MVGDFRRAASGRFASLDGAWLCLGLDKLIEVKRAAGRPKDLEVIAELVAIRALRG